MKILLKKYGWIALAVLIAIIFLFQKCTINKLKDANELQNIELSTLNDSVSTYRTKSGQLITKIISVQIESDNAKEALEVAGFEIKKLKDAEVKWRDVTIALKAELKAANAGTIILHDTTIVNNTDTVTGLVGSWSDDYLYLRPYIVKKEMKFNYTYGTGINFFVTKNGNESVVTISLTNPLNKDIPNPYARITTANSISIIQVKHWYEKPWLWGVTGLVGGYFIGR